MSHRATERGLNRRDFVFNALALGGLTAAAGVAGPFDVWGAPPHRPLDPVNPDILFGSTSSLWGAQHDIEWAIKRIAALGLQGIEPYANQIEKYRGNPLALKKLFDDAGVTMIDVSSGAKGQSTNFIDPDQIPKTIARPCRVRARFSPAVQVRFVEMQHGARQAGWRRSAIVLILRGFSSTSIMLIPGVRGQNCSRIDHSSPRAVLVVRATLPTPI